MNWNPACLETLRFRDECNERSDFLQLVKVLFSNSSTHPEKICSPNKCEPVPLRPLTKLFIHGDCRKKHVDMNMNSLDIFGVDFVLTRFYFPLLPA